MPNADLQAPKFDRAYGGGSMKYSSVPSRNDNRFNGQFQSETVPVDLAVGANLLRARNDLQVAIGEDVARKRAGTKDFLGAETAKYIAREPE